MIRIVLAEDHSLVRAGLRALLERSGDIQVVGEASNGQETIDRVQELKPDVLVMDIMMPRLNGIQAAERIRDLKIQVHILIISMYADKGLVHQALQSGVKGYVLKTSVSEELLLAIRTVARGETYLSNEISSIAVANTYHPRENNNPLGILSPREKEVMQLIAEEHTSAEIAKILVISEKTVEKHRANLMEKLSVHNLVGLVRLAVKYGLVDRES